MNYFFRDAQAGMIYRHIESTLRKEGVSKEEECIIFLEKVKGKLSGAKATEYRELFLIEDVMSKENFNSFEKVYDSVWKKMKVPKVLELAKEAFALYESGLEESSLGIEELSSLRYRIETALNHNSKKITLSQFEKENSFNFLLFIDDILQLEDILSNEPEELLY